MITPPSADEKCAQNAAGEIERAFWTSVYACPHTARLGDIGNELNKVRLYANEHDIDDHLSESIAWIAISAYYAGVSPLIRIEHSLNVSNGLNNEYAFTLAARAYIEVAGRIHKSIRLWNTYDKDQSKVTELHNGALRLLCKYTPKDHESESRFKGNGFNVMTFIQSLEDKIPGIGLTYDTLSSYVHGGFHEQRSFRLQSWTSQQRGKPDEIIQKFAAEVEKVRAVAFADLEILLIITKTFRERYDTEHP